MTHELILELSLTDGVLVRVLGLSERRGYRPVEVSAARRDARTLDLALTVHSERPIELLLRQLDKLFDVRSARLADDILLMGAAK